MGLTSRIYITRAVFIVPFLHRMISKRKSINHGTKTYIRAVNPRFGSFRYNLGTEILGVLPRVF